MGFNQEVKHWAHCIHMFHQTQKVNHLYVYYFVGPQFTRHSIAWLRTQVNVHNVHEKEETKPSSTLLLILCFPDRILTHT